MAIIHKAIKSKPWIVRYKEPWSGKARTRSFSTEAEAKAFDEAQSQVFDRERAIIKATKRRRKLQAAPSITVADVIDRYLDSLTNLRTRKSCAHHLKSIRDIYGERKAHCMTLEDMDAFLKVQRERGVGKTTANRRAGLLRTAFNHAVRWGLLSVNPLASMRLAAQPRQTPDPPTLHEAKLIYNSASEHVKRVVLLGLATGARIGPSELFRLRWSDVDLEHAILRMPQAAKGARAEGRPVPIRRDVLDQLQAWAAQDAAIQCPWVINYHGKAVRNIGHAWRKALQRAGIERRIRPYDLRHAFCHALRYTLRHALCQADFLALVKSRLLGKLHRHQVVAVHLDALVVHLPFLLGQGGNIDDLFQPLEHRLPCLERHPFQCFHVFQYIYPTFKIILAFTFLFSEGGQFQEDKPHFVRERLPGLPVSQLHVRP